MEEHKENVTKKIGALARPDDLIFAAACRRPARQDHAPLLRDMPKASNR